MFNEEDKNEDNFSVATKKRPLSDLKKIALDLSPFEPIKPLVSLTPEAVLSTLHSYFKQKIQNKEIPTITGIAMLLGMTRRELNTFVHEDPQITRAVKLALQVVIEYVERLLLSGRPPIGLIFWLKNMDNWVDRTEVVKHDKTMLEIIDELEQQGKIVSSPVNTIHSSISMPSIPSTNQ